MLAHAASAVGQAALPSDVTLSWRAPEGCPGGDEARAALAELLGSETREDGPELDVAADVTPESPSGYRLTLRFEGDREGERSLVAAECSDLSRAAAVLIHLVLAEAPEAAGADIGKEESAPEEETEEENEEGGEASRPPGTGHLGIGPALGLDVGTLPAPVSGIGGRVSLALGVLELGLDGAYFASTAERLEDGAAAEVVLGLWQLGVGACLWPWPNSLRLGPCGGVELQVLSGESSEVAEPDSESQYVAAARLGGALLWIPHAPVAVRLDLGAALPLARSSWRVEGYAWAHRPAVLSLRADLGLVLML